MRNSLILLLLVFGIGVIVFLNGPRPDTDDTITFSAQNLPEDIDAYLRSSEANIPNLVKGTEKEIVWSSKGAGEISDIAIVYVHGFSATKHEIRPIPDLIASALDANLYYMRLTGHGRDSEGLAQTSMMDWANDYAEAMTIARKIGKKIIVIGTSTGATLASWALGKPELMKDVSGMIFISPNYAIQNVSTGLMNMPWAEKVLPALMGETIEWEPLNKLHAKWWTYKYPSRSVFSMAALLKLASKVNYEQAPIPAFFIYSTRDKIVIPQMTEAIIERWGGDTEVLKINKSDDPNNHVIAGDIVSPSNTDKVSQAAILWIQSTIQN